MKIIYYHQQEAFDAIPNFEGLDETAAVAVANSNENCLVYDNLTDFVRAFNDGEMDTDHGYLSIVGKPDPSFTDAEKSLLRESVLCKIRQNSRVTKQISISTAIALIEDEKQTLVSLLNRI